MEQGLCSKKETLPSGDKAPAGADSVSVSCAVTAGTSLQTEEERPYTLSRGGVEVHPSSSEEDVFQSLKQDIDCTVAAHNRQMVFMHAGVVGWRGLAIVIPGRDQTGKSTLVAELVRRVAVHYSDTFAVLDEDGRVHPYTRPLLLGTEQQQPPDLRLERESTLIEPLSCLCPHRHVQLVG